MSDVVKVSPQALIDEFLTAKGKDVIKRLFYGFESANVVTKYDGVDEKLINAQLDVVKDLIYEYNSTLNLTRTNEALDVTDVTLEVVDMKVELKAVINDQHMKAFRAYLKGAGMSMDAMHFIEYLIQANMDKMAEELENGVWQAVLDTNPANIGNRKLSQRFNGYRKLAYDAAVAGKATVVTTGAITEANAVAKVNLFYKAANKAMRKKGFVIYCSYNTYDNYLDNYSATHQGRDAALVEVKRTQYSFSGVPLMLGGGKTFLVPVVGIGDDDVLIGTQPEFLGYGFNYEGQRGEWDIQKHGWEHWMLNYFPIGVQIMLKKAGFLLVNDRLTY